MQFANRLPFNQHLVPRYSESLAVPLKILNFGGDGKKFFRAPPQTLHQVSATDYNAVKRFLLRRYLYISYTFHKSHAWTTLYIVRAIATDCTVFVRVFFLCDHDNS